MRYRFSKHAVMYRLLPLVEDILIKTDHRGLPIESVLQFLITLRFYATASFQKVNGDLMTLLQSTISRIVFRVTAILVIVEPQMDFLDLVPEWPESPHDSRILQNSQVFMQFQQHELTGMLVGDAGYPALTFLLTPFRNPRNEKEQRYNEIYSRTQMVVERTFGVWKRRFPCLSRGLFLKIITCTGVISACAVLHNLSLKFKDILPKEPEAEEINDNEHL